MNFDINDIEKCQMDCGKVKMVSGLPFQVLWTTTSVAWVSCFPFISFWVPATLRALRSRPIPLRTMFSSTASLAFRLLLAMLWIIVELLSDGKFYVFWTASTLVGFRMLNMLDARALCYLAAYDAGLSTAIYLVKLVGQAIVKRLRTTRATITPEHHTSTDTTTGFFSLPPELRNEIYQRYLDSHDGHVNFKATLWYQPMASCFPKSQPQQNPVEPPSAKPTDLLLTNKRICNEMFRIFVHSTTFAFKTASDLDYFVATHRELGTLVNVKSVVLDQMVLRGPRELRRFLKLANQIPSLSNFEIDVDTQLLYCIFRIRRFGKPTLERLRPLLFARNAFHNISASAIMVRDPHLEKELHDLIENYHKDIPGQDYAKWTARQRQARLLMAAASNECNRLDNFNAELRRKIRTDGFEQELTLRSSLSWLRRRKH